MTSDTGWFLASKASGLPGPDGGSSSHTDSPRTARIPTPQAKRGHNWPRSAAKEGGGGLRLGKLPGDFSLQQPPVSRVQLKGSTRLVTALLRRGAEQRLNRAFRFVGHISDQLDGKGAGFPRAKIRRAIPSIRSRHLLRRELTVLGLRPSVWLISS